MKFEVEHAMSLEHKKRADEVDALWQQRLAEAHDNAHAWRVLLCFLARMARRAAQTIISMLVAFTCS